MALCAEGIAKTGRLKRKSGSVAVHVCVAVSGSENSVAGEGAAERSTSSGCASDEAGGLCRSVNVRTRA